MSVIVFARDLDAPALAARIVPCIPTRWGVSARDTDWGAVLAAGHGVTEAGDWMVLGVPTADSWGAPRGEHLSPSVCRDLADWGPRALQMVGGPCLAAHPAAGRIFRHPNGIIPLFEDDARRVGSTSRGLISKLLPAATVRPVPPGHSVDLVMGSSHATGDPADRGEALRNMTLRGVARELATHLRLSPPPEAGPLPLVGTREPAWLVREAMQVKRGHRTGTCLYLPDITQGPWRRDVLAMHRWVRHEVAGELWWRARLLDQWLYAPICERASSDLISLSGAQPMRAR